MMRMQPEAEGYSGQVSCGGAARRLDVSALSELRNRVAGAHDALDDASSAGARTANAPSFATAAAMSAEAVAEDDGLDARRRILRRRVLLALAASAAILATACWEYLPGILAWLADPQAVRSFVADHSVISRFVMLGINVTQIFLAFLPGEPVELASGYAFGFWEGTALCLVASGLATSAIYWATRRWGWSLVGLFFDRSLLDRFSWLNNAKRLELVMLVFFLIPGTPKDFLTYFAGLTKMRFAPVVLIATFGRIPSIVTSTAAASAAGSGNWLVVGVVVAVSLLCVALGGLLYRRLRAKAS